MTLLVCSSGLLKSGTVRSRRTTVIFCGVAGAAAAAAAAFGSAGGVVRSLMPINRSYSPGCSAMARDSLPSAGIVRKLMLSHAYVGAAGTGGAAGLLRLLLLPCAGAAGAGDDGAASRFMLFVPN